MKIIADLHTHTLVSQHAYSTIKEMAEAASEKGLLALGITDHGPKLPDGAIDIHFVCMRGLPETIKGVRLIRGIEANILDYNGKTDLTARIRKNIDFCIASYHAEAITPASGDDHTKGLIAVLNNDGIDCLGHIGNPAYECDYEAVVRECKRVGKCIEINSNSFTVRKGSDKNCRLVAELCMKYKVPVLVNSDAHSCYAVGVLDDALSMLNELDFPEELILNADYDRLMKYIFRRNSQS